MVFHDIVGEDPYDLWVGDEAWELDYYLHENPEQKRAAYAWLTDFVGWLPMPDGGQHEAFLTADYNAEMIGQIARYPRIRGRAIFVGAPDNIVPDSSAPACPPSGPGPRPTTTSPETTSPVSTLLSWPTGRRYGPNSATQPRTRCASSLSGVRAWRATAAAGHCLVPLGPGRHPRPSDDRRGRTSHRPGTIAGPRWHRDPCVRA